MNDENSDEKFSVAKIRAAKLKIEQDAQDQQEEVKKIKEDLKKYKQELKDQEKAKRDFEYQQELKRKMEEGRAKMQQEVEAAKKHMIEYKLSKFGILLSNVFTKRQRHLKGQLFQQLVSYTRHLHFKSQTISKMQAFATKSTFYRLWRTLYTSAIAQRELELYERQQQELLVKEHTAELHRRRVVKLTILKAFKKNVKWEQEGRRIEQQHEQRKYAIDEFFENLKEKARNEEERIKREKIDKIMKEQIKDKLREVSRAYGVNMEERLIHAGQMSET